VSPREKEASAEAKYLSSSSVAASATDNQLCIYLIIRSCIASFVVVIMTTHLVSGRDRCVVTRLPASQKEADCPFKVSVVALATSIRESVFTLYVLSSILFLYVRETET